MNRYEFSFLHDGRVHFAVVEDESIESAAERVYCRPCTELEFHTSETGNIHVKALSEGTLTQFDNPMMVKVNPVLDSFVVPECKPTPQELAETRGKKTPSVDDVLASLNLPHA